MKKIILQMTLVASLLLGISACASQRPVLSSNAHLVRVGPSVAEREIDECLRLADAASAEGGKPGENVAAGTATSSVVGAAAGGAGGAVVGQAARGAAAGAAGGAAAGLTHALLQGLFRSKQPDPYYRQFVDLCLREKGYQPAGWR